MEWISLVVLWWANWDKPSLFIEAPFKSRHSLRGSRERDWYIEERKSFQLQSEERITNTMRQNDTEEERQKVTELTKCIFLISHVEVKHFELKLSYSDREWWIKKVKINLANL
jgi:hypothetical protein